MDEFHRPTATFPSGAYNATQVRLYGLDGIAPWALLLLLLEPECRQAENKYKSGKIGNYNIDMNFS